MKAPDKNSARSKRRKSRGFRSLEQDSRKHRRANRRLAYAQIARSNTHQQHVGGAMNYH